jgi:AbrB family looped-hinge helix DNA binding protein
MTYGFVNRVPKFFGAVTVGERGQVAIPAEARRELDINATEKLLVFGSLDAKALILVKIEFMTEFLNTFSALLSRFEQSLKTSGEVDQGNEKQKNETK